MNKLKVNTRYAVIPNNILNNKELSFRAKGVWAYIQSKPDGWNFSIKNIVSQSKEGIEAIRNAVKELENHSLLKRVKTQNELGHWDIEYLLLDEQIGKPDNGKPDIGKPDDGKPTNNSNKDIVKKNKVKKNKEYTFFQKKQKEPYFMNKPMTKDLKYVVFGQNDLRTFAGKKGDIEWK